MLETAFAQLRFAASIVFGVPFSARSLDRIVDGLIATQRAFGAIGSEEYELHTFIALGAISHLIHRQIASDDIVLISTSARATLGNTCFMGACARIGAQVSMGGLVDPAQTLALLAEPRRLAGKKPRVSVL